MASPRSVVLYCPIRELFFFPLDSYTQLGTGFLVQNTSDIAASEGVLKWLIVRQEEGKVRLASWKKLIIQGIVSSESSLVFAF